uniref:Reverse transcriptase domain-containing protein n=1 Tax=Ananas comosus var. bracteatus TaxID=296719 RepID=A0A6V7QC74_ANACO|nr:unnamed protein product [Ananas comosus var. bracteatus]
MAASFRLSMEPGPSSSRPSTAAVFLPTRPPTAGQPPLFGCNPQVDIPSPHPQDIDDILTRGLAARFGVSSSDFRVASFLPSTRAVFFPSWAVRESAIERSPFKFEGFNFHFSNRVVLEERERGYLRHKVWIRLHNWPILCWNEEDVKAVVCEFGELWDVDIHNLIVEDRSFSVPIEIEFCEEANPILLGEELDEHLGLAPLEAQEGFIRQTGFNSIPAYRGLSSAIREQAKRCLLWIDWLDKAEEGRLLTALERSLSPKLKADTKTFAYKRRLSGSRDPEFNGLRLEMPIQNFFLLKANARRNKNFISKLSNGSATLSSPESIAKHLFFFFLNQLGMEHVPSASINLKALYGDEHLDLSSIQAPFTLSKVRRAVFSSASEKAPGPDGLSMLFYKRFWNLLKDDIMGVFNTFYCNTLDFSKLQGSTV